MGQKLSSSEYHPPKGEEASVSRNRFDFIQIIGRGGFGKVWHVQDKRNHCEYAMKELKKVKVIDKKSETLIKYERELLSRLTHPFIVNMHFAFQDYHHLYLAMDLLKGGDLRYHITRQMKFSEDKTKFFLGCIIIALEYIHSKNVIHRDIKPENLVLDEMGYVRVTDFGIAKYRDKDNANETSGTPGYMSPEVMEGISHTQVVDYYALGVIGYELMIGKRPHQGQSWKEMKSHIAHLQFALRNHFIPGCSIEGVDFINKLLTRKPESRLGSKGINEIKDHPWFYNFPWDDVLQKKFKAPFIPNGKDHFDKKYCQGIDQVGLATKLRYDNYLKSRRYDSVFENFTFYNQSFTPSKPKGEMNEMSYGPVTSRSEMLSQRNSSIIHVESVNGGTINVNSIYGNIINVNSAQGNTINVNSFYGNTINVNSSQKSTIEVNPDSHLTQKKSFKYQSPFNHSKRIVEEKKKKRTQKRNANQHFTNMSNLNFYNSMSMNTSRRSISTQPKQYPNEYRNSAQSTKKLKFAYRSVSHINQSSKVSSPSKKKEATLLHQMQNSSIAAKIRLVQRCKSNFGSISSSQNSYRKEEKEALYLNSIDYSTQSKAEQLPSFSIDTQIASQREKKQTHPPPFKGIPRFTPEPSSFSQTQAKRKKKITSQKPQMSHITQEKQGISLEKYKSIKLMMSNNKGITINRRGNMSSSLALPINDRFFHK